MDAFLLLVCSAENSPFLPTEYECSVNIPNIPLISLVQIMQKTYLARIILMPSVVLAVLEFGYLRIFGKISLFRANSR